MGMAHFVHTKTWKKGQFVLCLFLIGLCTLIIFAPRLNESTKSQPSPLALSAIAQNYTFLAIPQGIGGDLHRVRNSQSDNYRRTLWMASTVALLCEYRYLPSNPGAIAFQVSLLDSIRQSFRQVCQLLDLPPPSALS